MNLDVYPTLAIDLVRDARALCPGKFPHHHTFDQQTGDRRAGVAEALRRCAAAGRIAAPELPPLHWANETSPL